MLSGIVAVVGAVTGVLSVVQFATRDTSSLATLTLSAAPVSRAATEFALPLSKLGAEFPVDSEPCGAVQRQWLNENATEVHRLFRIEMRNTASEGAMLALTDFRADATPTRAAEPSTVLVVCPTDAPASAVRAAGLTVDVPDTTARFRTLRGSTSAQPAPEIPVTWNLAPGESGTIDLELSAESATSGSIIVTMLSGRDQTTVPVAASDFELPGLWRHGDGFLAVGTEGLECRREGTAGAVPCDDADLADLTRARDTAFTAS